MHAQYFRERNFSNGYLNGPQIRDTGHFIKGRSLGVGVERGALIAGKYELQELLGRGGMGEVWAGRDKDLHRQVAVKMLVGSDGAAPELLRRFEREAVATAQINHPNVVAVYDRGLHDGTPYLVMEHIGGVTLTDCMREPAMMHPARALTIAQGVCAALVAAHRAKVVHYDIKPSNIMLAVDGGVKVVDFGIAGFTQAHTFTVAPTSLLTPAGTAMYGAPDQFLDQRGDERSDLYALGSVLYALLVGAPPFTGPNDLSVVRRKLDEEPPWINTLRAEIPESIARLLNELLQRDPANRPQTAEIVYQRLEEALASEASLDAATGKLGTKPWPLTKPLVAPLPATLPLSEAVRSPTVQRRLVDERRQARGYRLPADGLRAAVYWLLGLFTFVGGLTVIHQLTIFSENGREGALEDFFETRTEDVAFSLLGAQAACGIILMICWLMWFYRARARAEQFAPGRLRYSPFMAVLGWFIPVANLFIPKQIANDIWHASSRSRDMAPALVLHAWWCTWLISFLTWPLLWAPWTETASLELGGDYTLGVYAFDSLTWFKLFVNVLVAPVAVVTALFVHRLTAMQAAKSGEVTDGHEIVMITFANFEADIDDIDEITAAVLMTPGEVRDFNAGTLTVADDPGRWGIKIPEHWHDVLWGQVDP
ncbi:MAG: protein kinase [Corynebacteriales bacterium]|nr:protein kinase [Mycobacteriales bacterium]